MAAPTVATHTFRGMTREDRIQQAGEILERHNVGVTINQLAVEFGLTRETIRKRIALALDTHLSLSVDQYRVQQNLIMDRAIGKIEQNMVEADSMIEDARATGDVALRVAGAALKDKTLDRLLRYAERRSKLNGLDMPVRVEAAVLHIDGGVAPELVRLAEQLGIEAGTVWATGDPDGTEDGDDDDVVEGEVVGEEAGGPGPD